MTPPEASPGQIWRIVDANLNRIGEGLRLLEDVARLVLDDAALTQELKTIRHHILEGNVALNQRLLQYRDATGDVGINLEQAKPRELSLVLVANSRRVQESLRVVEELAKVPGISLDSEKFKQARFNLYSLERDLLARLLRRDKTGQITGVYFMIEARRGQDASSIAAQAISGGVRAIQFSSPASSKREFLAEACRIRELCRRRNILFIIDNELDIMLATDADGLMLEPESLAVGMVRRLLPIDKILGVPVHTVEEAVSARSDGADYFVLSQPERETLSRIKKAVTSPVVAKELINMDNISVVPAGGADALAVSSAAILENIEQSIRRINIRFEANGQTNR